MFYVAYYSPGLTSRAPEIQAHAKDQPLKHATPKSVNFPEHMGLYILKQVVVLVVLQCKCFPFLKENRYQILLLLRPNFYIS